MEIKQHNNSTIPVSGTADSSEDRTSAVFTKQERRLLIQLPQKAIDTLSALKEAFADLGTLTVVDVRRPSQRHRQARSNLIEVIRILAAENTSYTALNDMVMATIAAVRGDRIPTNLTSPPRELRNVMRHVMAFGLTEQEVIGLVQEVARSYRRKTCTPAGNVPRQLNLFGDENGF